MEDKLYTGLSTLAILFASVRMSGRDQLDEREYKAMHTLRVEYRVPYFLAMAAAKDFDIEYRA